jgi:hypothetical protein
MKRNISFINNKVKDFKINVAYEQWLREFVRQPNNSELESMEEDLISANNGSYNPLMEA